MAKGKPVMAWAGTHVSYSSPCEWLIRDSEKGARRASLEWLNHGVKKPLTWIQYYRRGWRVVRVRIEEVT